MRLGWRIRSAYSALIKVGAVRRLTILPVEKRNHELIACIYIQLFVLHMACHTRGSRIPRHLPALKRPIGGRVPSASTRE